MSDERTRRKELADSFAEQPSQTSVSWQEGVGTRIVVRSDFTERELSQAARRVRNRTLRHRIHNWRTRNRGIDLDGWKWWIV